MKKDTTTFGQEPERLARLLGMGVECGGEGESDPDTSKEELLRLRLAGTLPLETAVIDAIPAIAGRLCEELLPLRGKALGESLLDEGTALDVLEKVKAYGKKLAAREDSDVEHAVSVTIYFAAIASALLFHDRKITSYTYPGLAEAFGTLIDKPWMEPALARHFSKARKFCKKRSD